MWSTKSVDLIGHIKFLAWWQLDGCSITRHFPPAKSVACEARPAIVQSYSQIQARVRFVTSLKMDNFNCLKMMQISKNSQLVYDIGGAHSLVEAYIASPTSSPYVGIKTTQLYSTQNHCSAFLCRSVPAATINYSILVKVQSSNQSTRTQSPTRLGIWPQDLGLPNKIQSWPLWPFCCLYTQTCILSSRHYALLTAT